MTLKYPSWGDKPVFEWDEFNEREIWDHSVRDFEVEECFENDYVVRPHKKARSEPVKYGDRYMVTGSTNGGRKLVVIVQHKEGNLVRPITAWDI